MVPHPIPPVFSALTLVRPLRCALAVRPMLRIERHENGGVVFRVSGRLSADNASELLAEVAAEGLARPLALDLKDVVLVDGEIVRFLRTCARNGITLLNCPSYIREWIAREGEQA